MLRALRVRARPGRRRRLQPRDRRRDRRVARPRDGGVARAPSAASRRGGPARAAVVGALRGVRGDRAEGGESGAATVAAGSGGVRRGTWPAGSRARRSPSCSASCTSRSPRAPPSAVEAGVRWPRRPWTPPAPRPLLDAVGALRRAGLLYALGGERLARRARIGGRACNDWDLTVDADVDTLGPRSRARISPLTATAAATPTTSSTRDRQVELIARFAFFVPGGVVRIPTVVASGGPASRSGAPMAWAVAYALLGRAGGLPSPPDRRATLRLAGTNGADAAGLRACWPSRCPWHSGSVSRSPAAVRPRCPAPPGATFGQRFNAAIHAVGWASRRATARAERGRRTRSTAAFQSSTSHSTRAQPRSTRAAPTSGEQRAARRRGRGPRRSTKRSSSHSIGLGREARERCRRRARSRRARRPARRPGTRPRRVRAEQVAPELLGRARELVLEPLVTRELAQQLPDRAARSVAGRRGRTSPTLIRRSP